MEPAEPRELGALQARNGAEDARLLAVLELGLETDHVVERAQTIVLAQLHDGVRFPCRACGLVSPNGFIGPWRALATALAIRSAGGRRNRAFPPIRGDSSCRRRATRR